MKRVVSVAFFSFFILGLGFARQPISNSRDNPDLLNVDFRKLVSAGDLVYSIPASRSDEGLPVGNGRMGSLVWTSPVALKMQINRVDVFPMDKTTNSFPRRHTDYVSGCGYVDINMVSYGKDIFAGPGFSQHLELYDGLLTTKGEGITARELAWNEQDVMAIEIVDSREQTLPVNVDLRMLRYVMQHFGGGKNYELTSKNAVMVETANHTAISKLDIQKGRIILTQEFRENAYYNASAVAISIVGRESKARYLNELTVQLTAAPGKGSFTVLIASAASFNPEENVADLALKALDKAEAKDFEGLLTNNKAWWHNFWSKSFVQLSSGDGVTDFIQQNYVYYMYLMGSSSRGAYPPRFGGMLWYTTGDQHAWGSQFWWWNQSCLYDCMPATNRFELMDGFYSMYSKNYDSYAMAAQQQWDSKGIWLPETSFFNGIEELPGDLVKEFQDLYMVRKPWEERSEKFRWYAASKPAHNSRWNWEGVGWWDQGHWIIPDKGTGAFGHVTHIFSSTAKMAYFFWLRFEYTQDRHWLQEYAYPMLKGAVEFYRNFPNVKKDSTGKYQIYKVNNQEEGWEAQNAIEELAAIRGMTPILIRASEILNTDAEMRPVWKEFVDNFAPLPTSDNSPETSGSKYWVGAASSMKFRGQVSQPRPNLIPATHYDLLNIATKNADMVRTGNATFSAIYPQPVNEKKVVGILDKDHVAAAHLGRAADLKYMIYNQMKHIVPEEKMNDPQIPLFRNRMTLQEGEGAISAEHLGSASAAIHEALLQSGPPAPGEDPVIYIFPAWPQEWDATYKLGARGGFLVSASRQNGEIILVEIRSIGGNKCLIKNPWPGKRIHLYRNGRKAEGLSGDIISFPTQKGEIVALSPGGKKPQKLVIQ